MYCTSESLEKREIPSNVHEASDDIMFPQPLPEGKCMHLSISRKSLKGMGGCDSEMFFQWTAALGSSAASQDARMLILGQVIPAQWSGVNAWDLKDSVLLCPVTSAKEGGLECPEKTGFPPPRE